MSQAPYQNYYAHYYGPEQFQYQVIQPQPLAVYPQQNPQQNVYSQQNVYPRQFGQPISIYQPVVYNGCDEYSECQQTKYRSNSECHHYCERNDEQCANFCTII